jgi:crotonobetainyl-CoA:carnitine CoA-transferase CaiB-like acyl-CoA transferase
MKMLEGVMVVELAQWAFVPSAGAILADWGATVIKIEDPKTGDPLRGLILSPGRSKTPAGLTFLWEQINRGKLSVGLDIRHPKGYSIFVELIKRADVFLTSVLEPTRRKLRIDYMSLSQVNPYIIYARGHGYGIRGPDANKPGFDSTAYWSRAGVAYALTPPNQPLLMQRPAFGDIVGGIALAAGISAALYRRKLTGEGATVDVSLLATGIWQLSPDILVSDYVEKSAEGGALASVGINPLTGPVRTSDDRYLMLTLLPPERYWPLLCRAIEREDLITKFSSFEAMRQYGEQIKSIVGEAFRSKPADYWIMRLNQLGLPFALVQRPDELLEDEQVKANSYLLKHPLFPGAHLCSSPVQFNEQPIEVARPAPELGQHTEEILLDLGLNWQEISALKDEGVIT